MGLIARGFGSGGGPLRASINETAVYPAGMLSTSCLKEDLKGHFNSHLMLSCVCRIECRINVKAAQDGFCEKVFFIY